MRSKNRLMRSGLLLILTGLLSSCDYSDFSFFGFFYKHHIDKVEESLKKPGSNKPSTPAPEEAVFSPETYVVKNEETKDGTTVEKYQQFTLLSSTRYALSYYSRSVNGGNAKTLELFSTVGTYRRTGNNVTLGYEANTYCDERTETNLSVGDNDEVRKRNIESAFGSKENKIALNADGTFAFGSQSSNDTKFTGLSTVHTYYTEDTSSRPTYNLISVFDDGTYFLSSFAKNSSNVEQPVSALIGLGEYKKYDIKDDSIHGKYETIRIDKGHGYMFAVNGSAIKFDCNTDAGIESWYGMSFGTTRSIRITDEGYSYSVESGIEKYDIEVKAHSFEVLKKDVDEDPKDPVKKEALFSLVNTGDNKNSLLDLYKDGTYVFSFTTYNVEESGTWSYDAGTDTLILTCKGEGDAEKVNTFALDENSGDYTIHYVSLRSAQMTGDFTIASAGWNDAFMRNSIITIQGVNNQKKTLEFFDNDTFEYHYLDEEKNIDAKESGTYSFVNNTLTLTLGDKTMNAVLNDDGNYQIDYVSQKHEALNETFVFTKAEFYKTFPVTLATLKGEKKDTFTFTIFSNDSFTFHYEIEAGGNVYSNDENGSYSYDTESDSVTFHTVLDNGVAGDSVLAYDVETSLYEMNYVSPKNAALSQKFVMDKDSFSRTFNKPALVLDGMKSPTTRMNYYLDGTYVFDFNANNYHITESGTYEFDNQTEELVMTCQDKVNKATKDADGNYNLEYVSKKSDAMNQKYSVSATKLLESLPIETFKMDSASKKGNPIYMHIYSNHSYRFEWNLHAVVNEYGTWSLEDGKVIFRHNKTVNTLSLDGDSYKMDYVSDRSSMMTQKFEMSTSDFASIFNA